MKSGKKRAALAAMILTLLCRAPARAYQPGTLYSGSRGEEVRQMQSALIQLGYLGGTPDGIFGTHTENAVRKFQRANGLTSDGLAGAKTLEAIYRKAGASGSQASGASSSASSGSSPSSSEAGRSESASSSSSSGSSSSSASSSSSSASSSSASGLFGGNYATLRIGDSGSRVVTLQKRLISLGYLKGSADGKFGNMTRQAVVDYQRAARLTADGLAGKKTLSSLEGASASSGGSSSSESASSGSAASQASAAESSSSDPSSSRSASGPAGGSVRLLHWFNDVKPSLRSGQTLTVWEPSSGKSWNLRIYSCGRHCDAEPCTAEDTASMLKAFGNVNTWSQKAVYVKLPNGTWTVGSTHDMPHMSGAVSDNNFNGHLCVHFLRTMSEARQNDPSYGVANQNTIRSFWKSLTGEEIQD